MRWVARHADGTETELPPVPQWRTKEPGGTWESGMVCRFGNFDGRALYVRTANPDTAVGNIGSEARVLVADIDAEPLTIHPGRANPYRLIRPDGTWFDCDSRYMLPLEG